MDNFTPWSALLGGSLLGLSAALLLLARGRIAGISGVIAGLFKGEPGNFSWRLMFLLGIMIAPLLLLPFGYQLPKVDIGNPLWLGVAGLLVGIGTKLGNGCTSGHGICGLGRFSKRSLFATLTFMAAAFAVVALRTLLGGW